MSKFYRYLMIGFLTLVTMLVICFIILHTAFAKKFVRNEIQKYVASNTNTEFNIQSVNYTLPKWIELEGVFIRDTKKDTLLFGKKLRVDLKMLQLLNGNLEIEDIQLDGIYANIAREKNNENYNYQFIIDAFSSPTPKTTITPKDTTGLQIILKDLMIHNSHIQWKDAQGGLDMNINIGNLNAQMDKIDLKKQEFILKKGDLNKIVMSVRQYQGSQETTNADTTSTLPTVIIQDLVMNKSVFNYENLTDNLVNRNVLNEVKIKNLIANLNKNNIQISNVALANSSILVNKNKPVDVLPKVLMESISSSTFVLAIKSIDLKNNNLVYNDNTVKSTPKGLDFAHLGLKKITLKASDILYAGEKMGANILQAIASEKSGLDVEQLKGKFTMDQKVIVFEKLFLETPHTKLDGNIRIYQAALDSKYKGDEVNVVNFKNSIFGKKDIALLLPDYTEIFEKQLRGAKYIYLTLDGKGLINRLNISKLIAYTDKKDAYLNLNGSVGFPFDPNKLTYNLNLTHATFTDDFLIPFVNNQNTKVILPPFISFIGSAIGNLKNIKTDIEATTNFGNASLIGSIINFDKPENMIYDATIIAKKLQTGKWIAQDSLYGVFDGKIIAKGSGIDYKSLTTNTLLKINEFRYAKHNYQNIDAKVAGLKGNYDFEAKSADPELLLNINGEANMRGEYPTLQAKLDIDNANLYSLGFYNEPLTVESKAEFKFTNLTPNNLDAIVILDSSIIIRSKQKIYIDSLSAIGTIEDSRTVLRLASPLIDANLNGDFAYDDLVDVFKHVLATYKGEHPEPLRQNSDLAFNAVLKPNPIFEQTIKGLYFDRPITVNATIDATDKDSTVSLVLNVPYMIYDNNALANFNLKIYGTQDSLKYNLVADTLRSSNLFFYQTSINGAYSANSLSANLVSKDDATKDRYALSFLTNFNPNEIAIKLKDNILLNYASWEIDEKNLIKIAGKQYNVSAFDMTNNNQKISINSTGTSYNSPIKVLVEKFRLSNITGIVNKDSLLVNGILNADLMADKFENTIPRLDGKLGIDSLVYNKIPVGDLALQATAENNSASMTGGLTSNGNNVEIVGKYMPDNLDIDLNLNPIKLKAVEPFSVGYLTNSKGGLSGNIKINGKPTSPVWNGKLYFDSVQTTVGQYGTILKIDKQELILNYPNIQFNNFVAKDSLNQSLIVNGNIKQTEDNDFLGSLNVKADNFMALNSNAEQNSSYYGKAIVDANMQINGNITAPEVSGNVEVKDKSKITYVREKEIPGLIDREGVMAFIDMDTVSNVLNIPSIELGVDTKTNKPYQSSLVSYNLNIDISRDAEFNIILDPYTNDQLSVSGPATLNAGVNPNGSLMLTGAYNLVKGKYTLNYQFIKREFDLQDGSSIIFKGNPTDAEANITAVYEVMTRPIDLIRNEITDINIAEAVYQQKMPFQVELKITGSLLEPTLAFDIKLKENIAGLNSTLTSAINNKLTQLRYDASSLNKQVFALLVMNRFFGEQARDFFAGGGTSTQDIVKASVSRFLSDAVNQIASDLIKGVDLNVDLKSVDDYASAAKRTDLDLALSKRFLNDRFSVTVGKNFTLEGEDPLAKSQNNSSVNFLPDINTTYKLSKNGKYLIRAYRKNQYEAILDGYFTETGLVFSFSLDYDKAKELLNLKNQQ